MRKVGRGEGQCMHEYLCICACCVSVKLSICRLNNAHLHNFRTHIYGTLYPGTYLALFWPPLSSATRFVCFFCCPFASQTRHAPSLHPLPVPLPPPSLFSPSLLCLFISTHSTSGGIALSSASACSSPFHSLCVSSSLSSSPFLLASSSSPCTQ